MVQGFCPLVTPTSGGFRLNFLDKKWPPTGKMFIWSNLGQNPSEIGVGIFARIKNLIWDQLLALLRLKVSRVKPYFRFACETEDFVIWYFCFCSLSKGIFNALKKVLRLASAMECADGDRR